MGLKLKTGVILDGLHFRMLPVLVAAEQIYHDEGFDLWVTSGLDGVHSDNSLHYTGKGLDFRTRFFTKAQTKLVFEKLKVALGRDYDYVLHSTHIHIEWDPK